ncbi:RNA-binding protein NOB1 [Halotydeus destructor]|nr:RNA-binding protein NOB1 [Halotydeus destructor]
MVISTDSDKVEHLVVDAGAFIRGAVLQDIANNVYTIQEVVNEIKDKATLERLQCLPYELNLKEPPPEDIREVVEFSKKTGDYRALSAVDIKLLGLAHYLERIHVGTEHLRKEPSRGIVSGDKPELNAPPLVGFYKPKHEKAVVGDSIEAVKEDESVSEADGATEKDDDNSEKNNDVSGMNDEASSDEGDDEGWITAGNIGQMKKAFTAMGLEDKEAPKPKVGLITTDFAIQNVVLQIGLKLVSFDGGSIIRQTRQFVLRCFACYKITNELGRKFCPACGNLGTLKRVSVTVNEAGEKVIHINFKRPISIRGTKYSLPTPRGGKHANNLVLVEDQRIPQHNATKFAMEEKRNVARAVVSDPNYVMRASPFAINDVYSRASRFSNLPGRNANSFAGGKKNPNAVRKATGNRKKNRD